MVYGEKVDLTTADERCKCKYGRLVRIDTPWKLEQTKEALDILERT